MISTNFIKSVKLFLDKAPKDSYYRNLKIFKDVKEIDLSSKITIFTGENGSGKTTLLEAIATRYGFNREGGTLNYNFVTRESYKDMDKYIELVKGVSMKSFGYFFKAESFYNVQTALSEYDKGNNNGPTFGRDLSEFSHGESFIEFFSKYVDKGLYILDEPESALSPNNQIKLLCIIQEALKQDAQFIIATNSPILLSMPNTTIYNFSGEKISKCNYEDTDAYKITENFINHKDIFLDELLK